jgi:hypothetical protein
MEQNAKERLKILEGIKNPSQDTMNEIEQTKKILKGGWEVKKEIPDEEKKTVHNLIKDVLYYRDNEQKVEPTFGILLRKILS